MELGAFLFLNYSQCSVASSDLRVNLLLPVEVFIDLGPQQAKV